MSESEDHELPAVPPWSWRSTSAATIGFTGLVARGFLKLLNRTETHGLDKFLELLDEREDINGRKRGLITVSNHVSVLDDPIIWGVLPLRYFLNPDNMRWSLGSYDICFKNRFASAYFTYGQVLPTHRLTYSSHGGLFQPTITQAIRLLSRAPFTTNHFPLSQGSSSPTSTIHFISDPFSSAALTYSTDALDSFPAPSAYSSRSHAWVHIFPEGKIHQSPQHTMRYFKWGVARLILEAEPAPDIVPMWIDGPQEIMSEERTWPRFVPRAGKRVSVAFGEVVRGDDDGGWVAEMRERWRRLRAREDEGRRGDGREMGVRRMGELEEEEKDGEEAVRLRMECTMKVREEVLKVRRSLGYDDEDPKAGRRETYLLEGGNEEGRMADDSVVKDM